MAIIRPENPKELFNLRHASARNVIERLFGIFKRRFKVLTHPPEYSLSVQAMLVPALAALHNFICIHDPSDCRTLTATEQRVGQQNDNFQDIDNSGELSFHISMGERTQASIKRDRIALEMWTDYQAEFQRRSHE